MSQDLIELGLVDPNSFLELVVPALQRRCSFKKPILNLLKAIPGDIVIPLADAALGLLNSHPLALIVFNEGSILLLVGHQVWVL